MSERAEGCGLNGELLDAFSELIGRLLSEGEKVAERFGVPVFAIKAMHWLDGGTPMKELGRRLRCDPSFVTSIADSLEKRGLARREPNPSDRRIKNLVLTEAGSELKQRVEHEMLTSMPWCTALGRSERETLLVLIRKLLAAQIAPAPRAPEDVPPSPDPKEVQIPFSASAAASAAEASRS